MSPRRSIRPRERDAAASAPTGSGPRRTKSPAESPAPATDPPTGGLPVVPEGNAPGGKVEPAPCVLAFELEEAVSRLAQSGWKVARISQVSAGHEGFGKSEQQTHARLKVVRQRVVGEREIDLLAAPAPPDAK